MDDRDQIIAENDRLQASIEAQVEIIKDTRLGCLIALDDTLRMLVFRRNLIAMSAGKPRVEVREVV